MDKIDEVRHWLINEASDTTLAKVSQRINADTSYFGWLVPHRFDEIDEWFGTKNVYVILRAVKSFNGEHGYFIEDKDGRIKSCNLSDAAKEIRSHAMELAIAIVMLSYEAEKPKFYKRIIKKANDFWREEYDC